MGLVNRAEIYITMQGTITKVKGQDVLTVEIPINVYESASGKTMVIASSRGNQPLPGVTHDGKQVILGLNAYVRK